MVEREDPLTDLLKAASDPTRRDILTQLAQHGPTRITDVAARFDISLNAVSKHIKILTECRLVDQEINGREIYYHFNPEKMKEVEDWLAPFKKIWEDRFDRLDNVLIKLKNQKKSK